MVRPGVTAADALGTCVSFTTGSDDGDECWARPVALFCDGALFWLRPDEEADGVLGVAAALRARPGTDPRAGPADTSLEAPLSVPSGVALANAGSDAIPRPTPRATASAPTRPT